MSHFLICLKEVYKLPWKIHPNPFQPNQTRCAWPKAHGFSVDLLPTVVQDLGATGQKSGDKESPKMYLKKNKENSGTRRLQGRNVYILKLIYIYMF